MAASGTHTAIRQSGVAYLDEKPTDQYIAECITGISDLSGAGAFFTSNPGRGLHYRGIRNRIASGLERAYANLPRTTSQTKTAVLASAIQHKGRGITRPMFRIDMIGDSASSIELVPRILPFGGYNLSAIGVCESGIFNRLFDELHEYRVRMAAASSEPVGAEGFRDLMMEAVRETGALAPDKVGRHVVGVILDPTEKKIRIVFSPYDVTGVPPLRQEIGNEFADLPKVPTPYVLKPGMCFGPAVGNPGGWNDPMTGITFEYSGFNTDDSGPGGGYFGTQPRKDQPR